MPLTYPSLMRGHEQAVYLTDHTSHTCTLGHHLNGAIHVASTIIKNAHPRRKSRLFPKHTGCLHLLHHPSNLETPATTHSHPNRQPMCLRHSKFQSQTETVQCKKYAILVASGPHPTKTITRLLGSWPFDHGWLPNIIRLLLSKMRYDYTLQPL